MSGIAGGNVVVQVGFVVRDIYETKKRWAQFLGVEEPPVGEFRGICGNPYAV